MPRWVCRKRWNMHCLVSERVGEKEKEREYLEGGGCTRGATRDIEVG